MRLPVDGTNKQITKLEAEVEALFELTLRAHARVIFLRPMMSNQDLLDRIGREAKGVGFRRLRDWLYWALVQELAKICSDNDPRSPSIARLTEKLKDAELRKQLEQKYVKNNREMADEAELQASFNVKYSDYERRAQEMLSSHAVGGYKTIRDKLISHNELRLSPESRTGYHFFDVNHAKLKYGDERKLLETLKLLIDDLLLVVRNVDFTWDTFFSNEDQIARDFWEVDPR